MSEDTAVAIRDRLIPAMTPDVMQAVVAGDLSTLTASQRQEYYLAKCHSLGLNPLSQPFAYIVLNGKLRLYTMKDCSEQLRKIHGVSLWVDAPTFEKDLVIVHVRAKDGQGREDEDYGYASVRNVKDDALGNAILKAITKGKRRVTLSICGLGDLDETEVESIPGAVRHSGMVDVPPHAVPDVETSNDLAELNPSKTQAEAPTPSVQKNGPAPQDTTVLPQLHPTTDQVSSLAELAKGCGVDLVAFGHHMRQLMHLSEDTRVTKKFLRESMTMAQHEEAWQHYAERLKEQVEKAIERDDDVPDFQPPGATIAPEEVSADAPPDKVSSQADADAPATESALTPAPEYATSVRIESVRATAQGYELGQMFEDHLKNYDAVTVKHLDKIEEDIERQHRWNLDHPKPSPI